MGVNDDACFLNERGVLDSIASRLAPTVLSVWLKLFFTYVSPTADARLSTLAASNVSDACR
jgi:hypothetical protein